MRNTSYPDLEMMLQKIYKLLHFFNRYVFQNYDDDDDDDDDDDNCSVVWFTDERRVALFPAGIIVRDPHHCESPTRREQDMNLCTT